MHSTLLFTGWIYTYTAVSKTVSYVGIVEKILPTIKVMFFLANVPTNSKNRLPLQE